MNDSIGWLIVLALAVTSVQTGCRNSSRMESDAALRWAAPVRDASIDNFHKVSHELYRGAQPDADGYAHLGAIGVRTVVNVRGDDRGRTAAVAANLRYVHLPMSHWSARDGEVVTFLRLFGTPEATPIFLHCQHGADRTGLLCAMYRIAVQGWSKQEAIEEMTRGGMQFHSLMGNLVKYIRNADIERLRRAAGLNSSDKPVN